MKFFLSSVFLLVVSLDNVTNAKIFKTKPYVTLLEGEASDFPTVPGAYQCGGSGEVRDVRSKGCKQSRNICVVSPMDQIQTEFDLVPLKFSRGLSLRIEVTVGDANPVVVHEDPVLASEVRKDVLYTMKISAVLHPDIKGKRLKTKWLITDRESGFLKWCIFAESVVY